MILNWRWRTEHFSLNEAIQIEVQRKGVLGCMSESMITIYLENACISISFVHEPPSWDNCLLKVHYKSLWKRFAEGVFPSATQLTD